MPRRVQAAVSFAWVTAVMSSSDWVTAETMASNGALHCFVQSSAAMTGPGPWPSLPINWSMLRLAASTWVAASPTLRTSSSPTPGRALSCWSWARLAPEAPRNSPSLRSWAASSGLPEPKAGRSREHCVP